MGTAAVGLRIGPGGSIGIASLKRGHARHPQLARRRRQRTSRSALTVPGITGTVADGGITINQRFDRRARSELGDRVRDPGPARRAADHAHRPGARRPRQPHRPRSVRPDPGLRRLRRHPDRGRREPRRRAARQREADDLRALQPPGRRRQLRLRGPRRHARRRRPRRRRSATAAGSAVSAANLAVELVLPGVTARVTNAGLAINQATNATPLNWNTAFATPVNPGADLPTPVDLTITHSGQLLQVNGTLEELSLFGDHQRRRELRRPAQAGRRRPRRHQARRREPAAVRALRHPPGGRHRRLRAEDRERQPRHRRARRARHRRPPLADGQREQHRDHARPRHRHHGQGPQRRHRRSTRPAAAPPR